MKNLNEKFVNAKKIKETSVSEDMVISRNPEIDATDLDGEVVMMNMEKGQYFMMNEVGSRIWELIEEPIKVDAVVNKLLQEFEVEKEECEKTVIEFINELTYADLIQVK
ncbi:MAG: lasso peptide biosynthesis PqqD family chaperone [Clostridium sp.]